MFIAAIEEWLFPKSPNDSGKHAPPPKKDLQEWSAKFNSATQSGHQDWARVRGMVRRGIPDALRGWAWARLLAMDQVPFEQLQSDYSVAFSETFGKGMKPDDVVFSHTQNSDGMNRVLAILINRHPLLDLSTQLLPNVLSLLGDYFDGEEMLLEAGERIIKIDRERRKNGDGLGMLPGRNSASISSLFLSVLRKESPALQSHLTHVKTAKFELLLFTALREIYPNTRIPCRLLDCWLVEGFKVNVRFAVAHMLLKQAELISMPCGSSLEAEIFGPASHPEDLPKTAFSLHFSRSLLQKKRLSLDTSTANAPASIQFGTLPRLAHASQVIRSYTQWQAIWHWIPPRFQNSTADLIFATYEHGRSLQYVYLRSALREPLVVLVSLTNGSIHGAYLSKSFVCRLSAKQLPYGTGETFIFTLQPDIIDWVWRPDPDNNGFIVSGGEEGIGVGVGEYGYAFHVDRELSNFRSHRSPVFDNCPLVAEDHVSIDTIEIWGFIDH